MGSRAETHAAKGGDASGRRRIIDSAIEVFGERGYSAAGIAAIAERAGVAKSVIYHHFGSKGGLYEAIVETQTADLVERVAAAVPTDPDAPRLRAGVDAYFAFLKSRPAVWRLLFRDPPADPELRDVHARMARRRAELLESLLTQAAKRGTKEKRLVAGLVTTAIRSYAEWWYDHPRVPRSTVTDAVVEFAAVASKRVPAPH